MRKKRKGKEQKKGETKKDKDDYRRQVSLMGLGKQVLREKEPFHQSWNRCYSMTIGRNENGLGGLEKGGNGVATAGEE